MEDQTSLRLAQELSSALVDIGTGIASGASLEETAQRLTGSRRGEMDAGRMSADCPGSGTERTDCDLSAWNFERVPRRLAGDTRRRCRRSLRYRGVAG